MLRILIADDSAGLRQGMRNLLSEASPQWIICGESADGEDAVRKTEELCPDVILLDLSIPRLRGLDVVKELRRKNLSTEVIIISAQDQDVLDHLARTSGLTHAIAKSQLASDLIPALQSLQRHREELA
jgi:DNA-binding NarL/FixJ family response regulator